MLPAASESRMERKANLRLSDTGDLECGLTVTYTGLEAAIRTSQYITWPGIAVAPLRTDLRPTSIARWTRSSAKPAALTPSCISPAWGCAASSRTSPCRKWRLYDVNVFGIMELTQAVLPHMRARRAGRS